MHIPDTSNFQTITLEVPDVEPTNVYRLRILTAPTLDRLEIVVNKFLAENADGYETLGTIEHYGHELFALSFLIRDSYE